MKARQPTLGAGVAIDVDALLASRMLLCANSGSGKSWALRKIVEETHEHCQQIIIDPEGEFSSLRERFDFVVIGPGGDLPADIENAELLGRRVRELRFSVIVDISELSPDHKALYVARFLTGLYEVPRELWSAALVILDEAHRFCPEKATSGKEELRKAVAESKAAVIQLMDSARKRGLCGLLATQRISKLSKDATGEANNKLIGRSLDVDARRAGDELGMTGRAAIQALRKLEPGEFFVFGPGLSPEVVKVRVGAIQTTHPRPGKPAPPTPPPRGEIVKVLRELEDLPAAAKAEAKSIEQLRERVTDLEAKLRAAPKALPPRVETRTINVVDDKQLARAEKALEQGKVLLVRAGEVLAGPLGELARALATARKSSAPIVAPATSPSPSIDGELTRVRAVHALAKSTFRAPAEPEQPSLGDAAAGVTSATGVLSAIATLQEAGVALTVKSVAAWLGVHPRTKAFLAAIGELRRDGLIDPDGLEMTANGGAVVRFTPTTRKEQFEILRRWLSESERRLLDVIHTFEELHRAPTHKAIAAWLGVHPRTKALLEDLGSLRSRGYLIDNQLSTIGALASQSSFLEHSAQDIAAALDEEQRSVLDVALREGAIETMSKLAELLDVHPRTKSVLTALGQLRSRGLITDGWPLRPTSVFPGVA